MAWIEKRGKGYRVKYGVYENGVRIQRSKSFPSAKEAKEFASKVEYEIDTGQYSYTKGRTLADVLNEWLEVYCVHSYLVGIRHLPPQLTVAASSSGSSLSFPSL